MKTSGSNAYSVFKDRRAVLERSARDQADTIHKAERRLQSVIARQGDLWHRLSVLHIGADVALPTSVRHSLDARHEKIEATKKDVESIKTRLSSLKRKRSDVSAQLSATEADFANEHAAVSARFDADARVVSTRRILADLSRAHADLEEKQRRADEEFASKRVGYEEDIFFMYLQNRKFDTEAYAPWFGLVRRLDAALAARTNYREERANYNRLSAHHGWIAERIENLHPEEERAKAEFAALEREFFEVLEPRKSAVAKRSGELRAVDREIEAENAAIATANKFLSDAALASDSEIKRISMDFANILKGKGFDDLERLAARTTSSEDDMIVSELRSLAAETAVLNRDIEAGKSELFSLERKIKSFEDVESHIRRNGWNDSGHGFNNLDADNLSKQLANDALTAGVIIGYLSNSHVSPPRRNDYGSGSGYSSGSSSSYGSSSDSYSTTSSFGGSDSYSTTDSF